MLQRLLQLVLIPGWQEQLFSVPKHLWVLVSSLGGAGMGRFDFGPHCLEQRATRKRPLGSDCGVAQAREPAAAGFCVALSPRQAGPLEG